MAGGFRHCLTPFFSSLLRSTCLKSRHLCGQIADHRCSDVWGYPADTTQRINTFTSARKLQVLKCGAWIAHFEPSPNSHTSLHLFCPFCCGAAGVSGRKVAVTGAAGRTGKLVVRPEGCLWRGEDTQFLLLLLHFSIWQILWFFVSFFPAFFNFCQSLFA